MKNLLEHFLGAKLSETQVKNTLGGTSHSVEGLSPEAFSSDGPTELLSPDPVSFDGTTEGLSPDPASMSSGGSTTITTVCIPGCQGRGRGKGHGRRRRRRRGC